MVEIMMCKRIIIILTIFYIFISCGCEKKVEMNNSSSEESVKTAKPAKVSKSAVTVNKLREPDYWFKFRGDLRNTGRNPRVSGPRKPVLKWKAEAKHEVMSSPVFTANNETLTASHDGNLYIINKKGEMTSLFQSGETLIASPLYISENIYIGGFDNFFYCLDNKFNVKYKFETRSWIASSASFMNDGSIVFASNDGYLYCLDSTGSVKWKISTGKQDYEIHSSPGIYKNTVVLGSGQGSVCAVDSDGKSLWHFKADSAIFASPAIDSDGNIFIGSQDGTFYSLDIDGNQRWKFEGEGGVTSSATITTDNSIIFATMKGSILCLNDKGELKWKYDVGAPIESSPCSDREGNVYIGCDDGKMRCFDSNGRLIWEFTTDKPILSSPALNNAGELVFGCEDKFVYCLKKDER